MRYPQEMIRTREEVNLKYLEGLNSVYWALYAGKVEANPDTCQAIIDIGLESLAYQYLRFVEWGPEVQKIINKLLVTPQEENSTFWLSILKDIAKLRGMW